jgi:hypothetical protein
MPPGPLQIGFILSNSPLEWDQWIKKNEINNIDTLIYCVQQYKKQLIEAVELKKDINKLTRRLRDGSFWPHCQRNYANTVDMKVESDYDSQEDEYALEEQEASKPAEHNYSTMEREALVAKEGFVKFQPFIKGEKVILIMDHSTLQWAQTYESTNCCLATWGTIFAAYQPNLSIVHHRGKIHSNVDPLSQLKR